MRFDGWYRYDYSKGWSTSVRGRAILQSLTEPRATRTDAILEIKDLRLTFETMRGRVDVLNGVNLQLKVGESLGIVGETGCGKSVTALSVLRLLDVPGMKLSGEILYKGTDLLKLDRKRLRKICGREIAMVFQEPMSSLNPVFTVGSQLTEVARLHFGVSKEEASNQAMDLLRIVGFKDPPSTLKRYPHELSGGMKQRVLLAMALSCKPSLLIADEPTTALDVTTQARILKLLDDLVKKFDLSLMLITHDIGIANEICNKLAVIYVGQVVEYGDISAVLAKPAHPYTQALIRAVPRLDQRDELVSIQGSVPSPLSLPAGCKFNPRCPHVMDVCRKVDPEPIRTDPARLVRCHLYAGKEPNPA